MPAYDNAAAPTCKNIQISRKFILSKTIYNSLKLVGILLAAFLIALVMALFNKEPLDFGTLGFPVCLSMLWLPIPIIAYIYYSMYYDKYYYDVKKDFVVIRRGVFAPKEISTPYSRIQNVFISRSIVDTFLGLYNVEFETAGSKQSHDRNEERERLLSRTYIEGLEEEDATRLKEMIIKRVRENY